MTQIYTNTIKGHGAEAKTFLAENMIVTFGDEAPDFLKDYCFFLDVNALADDIAIGDVLTIGSQTFDITAVGDVASKNLGSLGHLSIVFDGASEPKLPGAVNVKPRAEEVHAPEAGDTFTIDKA